RWHEGNDRRRDERQPSMAGRGDKRGIDKQARDQRTGKKQKPDRTEIRAEDVEEGFPGLEPQQPITQRQIRGGTPQKKLVDELGIVAFVGEIIARVEI